MTINSTQRFTGRVDHYHRYRPAYPEEILAVLKEEIGFSPSMVVADIGAGTGISAELFLRNGNAVWAVEPNREMREKAEASLARYPNFRSFSGRAEQTGLAAGSIDLVVSAQAFHWFDRGKTKDEFSRVLRPGGFILLLWNERLLETPFEKAYEEFLLRHGNDYTAVKRAHVSEKELREWFDPAPVSCHLLRNEQRLDFAGLRGRVLSSSYMPDELHPANAEMEAGLERLFKQYGDGGEVRFGYATLLFLGRPG
jgi:SAM-dependent methyltransferase